MTPETNVRDPREQINALRVNEQNQKCNNSELNIAKTAPIQMIANTVTLQRVDNLKLIKKIEVLALIRISKSQLHVLINTGLMPPSVSIGERAVAFVQHEIQLVLAARVAGRSNEEIKQLVSDLVSSRQDIYEREVKSWNM
tara:strand:- start:19799 stop:20221 length:423 start_codon:yes stop_codon:yes gene_type:complete